MPETKESPGEEVVAMTSSYEHLLQDVIRNHSNDTNVVVEVKDIQGVVPVGDNYLSILHRVSLEISRGNVPRERKVLIIKTLPKGEAIQKFIKEGEIFVTEIIMYKQLLPEMNRISSIKLGCSTFTATSFETDDDNLLVLEDLKQAGYHMADRHVGLDLDHCKMALRALARYHAISLALVDGDQSFFNMLPEKMFVKEGLEMLEKFIRPQYEELSKVIETWPGFERFGRKLRDVSLVAAEKVTQLNDRTNTEMAVLNHGDFWLNNMLFKYSDSGEVEDIKFLDFQMARFVSPAIDLHYFLVTSPSAEVRNEGMHTLIEIYHAELSRVLEALGCDKVMTLDWLKEEMKEKMFFALHVACTLLNIVVAEPEDAPNLSEISAESQVEESNLQMFKSFNGARYRQLLQKLLLIFEKAGIL